MVLLVIVDSLDTNMHQAFMNALKPLCHVPSSMFEGLWAAGVTQRTTLLPRGLLFSPMSRVDLAGRLWKRLASGKSRVVSIFVPCDPDVAFDAAIWSGEHASMGLDDFRQASRAVDSYATLCKTTFGNDTEVLITKSPLEAYRLVSSLLP